MTIRIALACAIMIVVGPDRTHAQPAFVVRDVRVFDGTGVSNGRSVLVREGVIHSVGGPELVVPPGTLVIDGRGKTLLPGLIDTHVHLSDDLEADLRQALSLGVTTVMDMFTVEPRLGRIKAIQAADGLQVADVRTAGVGATAPGGHPSQMGGPPFATVADSSDANAFVSGRVAEGSDFIKIVYDDLAALGMGLPMLNRRTLAGLISATHAKGKLAVVHVASEEQARTAVEEGTDGLAHLFVSNAVSDDFSNVVARREVFVIPTLTMLFGMCGEPSGPRILADSLLRLYVRPELRSTLSINLGGETTRSCAGTKAAVRNLAAAGVAVLVGTDAPVPGQTYGASVHIELQLLVNAGLSPIQALAAATSAAADAFRLADRGRIAPGLRADLILVDGDPTTDIQATRRIAAIWKRGTNTQRVKFED